MKRFQFRLKPLKRLKEAKYEEAERKARRQSAILDEEREKLRGLFEAKKGIREKSAQFHRELNFLMLEIARRNEQGINHLITAQELRIEEARKTLVELQKETTEALKEKKIFEKLEEKALEDYKKEYLRDQQKKLDDFLPRNVFEDEEGDTW